MKLHAVVCIKHPRIWYFKDEDGARRCFSYLTSMYGGYHIDEVLRFVVRDRGQELSDVGDYL